MIHRINQAETRTRMLELTVLSAMAMGALSAFTLSVFGVFILSSSFIGMLLLASIDRPFSPLELVTALTALQVSYLASGLITSFVRIRR